MRRAGAFPAEVQNPRRERIGARSPCAVRLSAMKVLLLLCAFFPSFPPAVARAEPALRGDGGAGLLGSLSFGSRRDPVDIHAAHLESDYKSRTFTFRGAVRVTQGDLTFDADRVSVKLDPEAGKQVQEVVAEGSVRIAQAERFATGRRAVFEQARRTVVLSDRATLHDGPNELEADTVTCYLDEDRCVAEGNVKVRIVPPRDAAPPQE